MIAFNKKALAAAALIAAVPVANAGVTISPMVGQMLFDNSMDVDNELFGSIGLGYQFDGPLGLELSYLSTSPETDAGSDLDITQLRLDALYHFNHTEAVTPYLLVGGGEQTYDFGSTDYASSILSLGGGLKAAISNGLSLRTEIRLINDMDMELTNYAVGLGLNYEFGKQSQTKKIEPVQTAPVDSDNDGVVDSSDQCPGTPAGTAVDVNGCEMVMDDDKDGVANAMDKCPDTSMGAAVDATGCYIVITEIKEVDLHVTFANNSMEVPTSSYDTIEEVADFMNTYPLTNVVIEGHTDDRGSAAYNQKLSQQRAEAVAKVLIDNFNVPATRVSAKGYGESSPLVDNSTAENRAKNRRVTAKVSASVETIKK